MDQIGDFNGKIVILEKTKSACEQQNRDLVDLITPFHPFSLISFTPLSPHTSWNLRRRLREEEKRRRRSLELGLLLGILIQGRSFLLSLFIEVRVFIYVCFASKCYIYDMKSFSLSLFLQRLHVLNKVRVEYP